jgi:hypothetical protein
VEIGDLTLIKETGPRLRHFSALGLLKPVQTPNLDASGGGLHETVFRKRIAFRA